MRRLAIRVLGASATFAAVAAISAGASVAAPPFMPCCFNPATGAPKNMACCINNPSMECCKRFL